MKKFNITDDIVIGEGQKLCLLAGPCVLESEDICDQIILELQRICRKLDISYIFKASFDKANRSSVDSYRGPGIEEGLARLQQIKDKYKVPIVTDIHLPSQAEKVAKVADILQIPAFLCRQTDLLIAASKTNKMVNIKKGQFMAPLDMKSVLNKVYSTNNEKISLCERGTSFGYNNLVVDMRSLQIMRSLNAPVIFDATHSVQLPGAQGNTSGGQPEFIESLSKAATAVGIDGLFMEVHPNPSVALSDGANSLPLDSMEEVLTKIVAIYNL